MIPKTKLQKRVFALSQALPDINKTQKAWAFKYCLVHKGFQTKTSISCLDCGHKWKSSKIVKSAKCPSCKTNLVIERSLKKKFDQRGLIMAIVDVVEDFQLIRYFEIYSYHKAGEKPRQYIWEVVQKWFFPYGKLTVVAKGIAYGSHGFHGNLEIRTNLSNYWNRNKYNLFTDRIYPKGKCLPILKRNGFSTGISDTYPYTIMTELLQNSYLETLLKQRQFKLAAATIGDRGSSIRRFWDSIKICFRNKYIVADVKTYLDYLELLNHLGKDMRSPKYVCPKNLKKEHDRYVIKRAKQIEEEKKLSTAEDTKRYVAAKEKFFGLVFREGDITISVLESVEAFISESEIHKHCVYTNRYYEKKNSLCFSARVSGLPIETVEVSLTDFKILQSRGRNNHPSIHHDAIVAIVNKNMYQIRKRVKIQKLEAA